MAKIESSLPLNDVTVVSFPEPDAPVELNAFAARAAAQYKDDFITPRMLSGIWRGVEFVLLTLIGLALFVGYVGVSTHLWESYVVLSLVGAGLGVLAINLADGYEISYLKGRAAQLWRIAIACS